LDYEVRVARLEDAAAVDRLLQVSYPKLMASSYDKELLAPALKLMTKANASLLGSGTYYVAELRQGSWSVAAAGRWNDPERDPSSLTWDMYATSRRIRVGQDVASAGPSITFAKVLPAQPA
jgi:hypothetical protein